MFDDSRQLDDLPRGSGVQRRAQRWVPGLSAAASAWILLLSTVFAVVSFVPLQHTDLWGHLAYGRWIVEHGQLPTSEPFLASSTARFQSHGWLAQVLMFGIFDLSATAGLSAAHAMLVSASVASLGYALRCRGVPQAWCLLGAGAGLLIAWPQAAVIRPQLVGAVAIPLVLCAAQRLRRDTLPMYWLPFLFALWAQLHGSWIVGLTVLVILGLGRAAESLAWRRFDDEERGIALRFAGCAVLCLAATLINPDGLRGISDALTFGSHPNLADLREWQPLRLDGPSGWLFAGSLLATAVVLRHSPRRWTLAESALLVLLAAGALLAQRMLIWWALVWPWVMAPHTTAMWPICAVNWRKRRTRWACVALIAPLITLAVTPAARAALLGRLPNEAALLSVDTPCAMADELANRGIAGLVFAPMDWSDYLIWHSHGRVKPLVYTHVHLIDPAVWRDYQAIRRGTVAWKEVARRHKIQHLLVSRWQNVALLNAVRSDAECRIVFEDHQGALVELLEVGPRP